MVALRPATTTAGHAPPALGAFELGLAGIFCEEERRVRLARSFDRLRDRSSLLAFLRTYVAFNSVFAGGVASLTGLLHLRSDLFRDPEVWDVALADRSAEVAARVFRAAEDEYHVAGAQVAVTHRKLAQRFIERVDAILGGSPRPTGCSRPMLHEFLDKVLKGYGVALTGTNESLFSCLGFHLASEQAASQEFLLLNKFLSAHYQFLVEELRSIQEPWGLNGYYWVETPCEVEEDHRQAALEAIVLALRYNTGALDASDTVREGYKSFLDLQDRFFDWSTSGSASEVTRW